MWDEDKFLSSTEGSPLRRAGYERWLRNLAVGLGNAPSSIPVLEALKARRDYPSELVREHVEWALKQHADASSERRRCRRTWAFPSENGSPAGARESR